MKPDLQCKKSGERRLLQQQEDEEQQQQQQQAATGNFPPQSLEYSLYMPW